MFNSIKEKINKMDKKKKILVLGLILLGLIIVILGATYAFYEWNTNDEENTNVVFNAGTGFSCSADGGGNITDNDVNLVPTYLDSEHQDEYIKREVKVRPTIDNNGIKIDMDLWLDINEIGSGLTIGSNFKYAFTTSNTSPTEGVIKSGNFKDKKAGDKIIFLDSKEYASTVEETYYLWIWLDISQQTDETMNQPFNLSLGGTCSNKILPKVYAYLGNSSYKFKADEYREKITKVEFIEGIDIPEGATTFELGTSPSAKTDVTGWLEDDGSGNDTYILKIGSNGKIYAKSLSMAFYNMKNVKEISFDNLDTSETTDMSYMFSGCSSLTTLDLNNFDTSNVTNMNNMFAGCSSLTTLDLSDFNTSKVTNMDFMFSGCSSLTTLDVGNFNTSNVVNMGCMFQGCSNLVTLDISNFDTSKVTNMQSMFFRCSGLTTLDLNNFDTSNVTNMNNMFYNCRNLTNLNLSDFNTSKVTNMDFMFSGCSSLATLDLSSFDTSNVTNMQSMFLGCSSLATLDLSSFDTSNVTNMQSMFLGCSSLATLDLSSFDTSNVTDMYIMFSGCSNLTNIYVSELWNTTSVTNSTSMFSSCNKLPNYNSSVVDKTNAHYNTGGYLTYKEYVAG